jgi:predicted O-methyltransferase YrrM
MDENGVSREAYRLWAGYVPDCFRDVDEHLRFSFVILDLDHYEPTVEALQWVWPRLAHGAILALDDFNPRMKGLAARAIKEFLRQANDFDIVDFFNNQLVLKKL